MWEVRVLHTVIEGGKKKKDVCTFLDETSETLKDAANFVSNYIPEPTSDGDADVEMWECIGIKQSNIKEVVNYPEDIATGWNVKMEHTFLNLDNGKEKKIRYNVLLFSDEIPDAGHGLLKDYMLQIDPDGNTFRVIEIKKSPIGMAV